ncbi:MAG: hypothetical protein ABIH69_05780 [bacterium]
MIQGRQFETTSKLSRLPINLHDFSKVQSTFAAQEAFRAQVLRFDEGIDLVAGEVNGEIFVLEAAQAEELIQNAADAENLIAGLTP